MAGEVERMRVLEMIESGQISAEDGLRLLRAMENGSSEAAASEALPETIPPPASAQAAPEPAARVYLGEEDPVFVQEDENEEVITIQAGDSANFLPEDAQKWKQWWVIPLWIGVAILISGGFLMYRATLGPGFGLWFLCASVPFLIGLVLIVLAVQSRTAPWLHLRVQQRPGERPQRIAISFPLPIRLGVWFFRVFGSMIPNLEETALDEVLLALGDTVSAENPIYIQADEGDDGEKVEIYIG